MKKNKSYLNQITTAVPQYECHDDFSRFILNSEPQAEKRERLERIIARLGIEKRYTVLKNALGTNGFYAKAEIPNLADRMKVYHEEALPLASAAVEKILTPKLRKTLTHLVITSCTGFYAPGLDLDLIRHFDLNPSLKRTLIGFMGCYAAVPGLRTAHDIVRADPEAKVLLVSLELCSLHFLKNATFEQIVSFLLFADGCAAALITNEAKGIELEGFYNATLPNTVNHMRWDIDKDAFLMTLSEAIPEELGRALPLNSDKIFHGHPQEEIRHWAIHPGGRAILSASEKSLQLGTQDLLHSRSVLKNFGNMSSATVLFVLQEMLANNPEPGLGVGMAFGPGLTLESFLFSVLAKDAA